MATDMNGSTTQPGDIKSATTPNTTSEPAPDGLEGLYPTIPGFNGRQFPFSHDPDEVKLYAAANKLYASSSHGEDHNMQPGLIVQPSGDDDVAAAIRYANEKGIKISIKSGGHQYSGACSTYRPNIMMDLGSTYKEFDPDWTTRIVKIGVSNPLKDVNGKLVKNNLFVPHGQCSYVNIGGHGQTGGYGNLARSFGLFGDHIRKIRLFDHSATLKEISLDSKDESDRNLFSAILGGSPGNFGIITHYYVQVYRDQDYKFQNGKNVVVPEYYRGIHLYRRDVLGSCLKKVAEMADTPDFERNYDLCISVLSSSSELGSLPMAAGLEEENLDDVQPQNENENEIVINGMTFQDVTSQEDIDEVEALAQKGTWPAVVVIYAQWVPFSKDDKFDPKWFKSLSTLPRKIPNGLGSSRGRGNLSEITSLWLFKWDREFQHPYDKRTYLTASTSLGKDGWVNKVTDRIDMVVNRKSKDQDLHKNCFLAVQIQCFGGKKAKFTTNQGNGTSYSWRDSTVVQVLDCFYKEKDGKGKALAHKWQEENDRIMKGKGSVFGEQDRRVLWGSYGNWDMKESWPYYYEDEAKYKKLGAVRGIADPKGTFTANVFAVEAISPS